MCELRDYGLTSKESCVNKRPQKCVSELSKEENFANLYIGGNTANMVESQNK